MTELRHRGATEKELQHQHSEDKVKCKTSDECCYGYHTCYMPSCHVLRTSAVDRLRCACMWQVTARESKIIRCNVLIVVASARDLNCSRFELELMDESIRDLELIFYWRFPVCPNQTKHLSGLSMFPAVAMLLKWIKWREQSVYCLGRRV